MRAHNTYRAARRKEPGNFVRLAGDIIGPVPSRTKKFTVEEKYVSPSAKERYAERKRAKLKAAGIQTKVMEAIDNG